VKAAALMNQAIWQNTDAPEAPVEEVAVPLPVFDGNEWKPGQVYKATRSLAVQTDGRKRPQIEMDGATFVNLIEDEEFRRSLDDSQIIRAAGLYMQAFGASVEAHKALWAILLTRHGLKIPSHWNGIANPGFSRAEPKHIPQPFDPEADHPFAVMELFDGDTKYPVALGEVMVKPTGTKTMLVKTNRDGNVREKFITFVDAEGIEYLSRRNGRGVVHVS
jgi:hypothetical protein